FEHVATGLAPVILILPGIITVIIGLFIWLGGMSFKRTIFGLIGAASGALCGYFIVRHNFITTAVSAALAALVAVILERLFMALILAVLAGIVLFDILAGPYVNPPQQRRIEDSESDHPQASLEAATLHQSIETVKAYAADFSGVIKGACSQMPAFRWAVLTGAIVVVLTAGFWFRNLTAALCCAVLGTALIFAGMVLLLLYKGSAPITRIADKGSLYATVSVAMIAFGTIEQLILCRRTEKVSKNHENKEK
ncbi:MAG: hypothetical protein MUP16_10655, partial [Sedimentisphaerales bacterium]|nr:hypothetical protein [Sedimentisphaerales bacterium]